MATCTPATSSSSTADRAVDLADAQWAAAPELSGPLGGGWFNAPATPGGESSTSIGKCGPDLVSAAEFHELVAAAMLTLPVNRSLTWTYAIAGAGADDLAGWGDAEVTQLRHILTAWPP